MLEFRKLLLATTLALTSITATAQNIDGRITDKQGQGVGYATVTLLDNDTTFLAGTTCDEKGNFSLPQNAKAKMLKVSYVGYKTQFTPIINNKAGARNTIQIEEDSHELQEVEVVSMRQLVKTESDRLSYNMEADPESKTQNLLDMLRKVPMVSVDGEENVRVQGSTSFKYYKNGRPDPSLSGHPKEVLKSIPAHLVKRIEVITEPGVKYDAEGVTAILNIVMVSGSKLTGLNGNVSATYETKGEARGSAYLAGQTGKLTLSGYYTHIHQSSRAYKSNVTTMDRTFTNSGTSIHSEGVNIFPCVVDGGNIEASIEFDSLNLLSGSVGGYVYRTRNASSENSFSYYNADGSTISAFDQLSEYDKYKGKSIDGRLDFEHKTHRPGEVLTLSYMYTKTGNDQDVNAKYSNLFNPSFSYTANDKWSKERFSEHTFQIDYTRKMWKDHKLEAGAKYIIRLNKSHTITTYDDGSNDSDDSFKHNTRVGAAYLSWMYSHGKLSAKAGLRYELARLEASYPDGSAEGFHSTIGDLVPSASINWRFSDFKSIRLSYSTSINRPGISYLNPAVVKTATSVDFGNPDLESSRNTKLGITYQQVGPKVTFNIGPSLRFTRNGIGDLRYAVDDVFYSTYANGERCFQASLGGYIQAQLSKSTVFVLNATGGYQRYKNPSLGLVNDSWNALYYLGVRQQLPWKLNANFTAWGGFGNSVSSVYSHYTSPSHILSLGLRRSFLKGDKLTVGVQFNSLISKYYKYKMYNTQGDYTGNLVSQMRMQTLRFSITYNFGKTSVSVKKANKSIENDDVVGGIKKQEVN